MNDPEGQLRDAVSSLRTVGTVFMLMGCVAAFMVWEDRARNLQIVLFVITSGVLWIGPGTLYHLTAVLIRRHDARIALVARRTAVAQSALAVVAVVVAAVTGQFSHTGVWVPAMMPAVLTIFFIPALLVQAYQIGAALEALRHVSMSGHGFEVQPPMPVLPVDAVGDDVERSE